MNGLYPIIRRVRRPLLPPEEAKNAVPVKESEKSALEKKSEQAKADTTADDQTAQQSTVEEC